MDQRQKSGEDRQDGEKRGSRGKGVLREGSDEGDTLGSLGGGGLYPNGQVIGVNEEQVGKVFVNLMSNRSGVNITIGKVDNEVPYETVVLVLGGSTHNGARNPDVEGELANNSTSLGAENGDEVVNGEIGISTSSERSISIENSGVGGRLGGAQSTYEAIVLASASTLVGGVVGANNGLSVVEGASVDGTLIDVNTTTLAVSAVTSSAMAIDTSFRSIIAGLVLRSVEAVVSTSDFAARPVEGENVISGASGTRNAVVGGAVSTGGAARKAESISFTRTSLGGVLVGRAYRVGRANSVGGGSAKRGDTVTSRAAAGGASRASLGGGVEPESIIASGADGSGGNGGASVGLAVGGDRGTGGTAISFDSDGKIVAGHASGASTLTTCGAGTLDSAVGNGGAALSSGVDGGANCALGTSGVDGGGTFVVDQIANNLAIIASNEGARVTVNTSVSQNS